MSGSTIFLLVIVGIVVIGGLIKLSMVMAERNRQRLAAINAWASENGFQFTTGDPFNLDGRYQGLGDIGKGHDRYATEVLARRDPAPIFIFRYHYKTWETRTVTRDGRTYTEQHEETHWKRYLMIELGAQFPMLFLRPEGFFDKVAGFVGFGDINFESEAFSSKYFCKSDNREFAYAVIHPQMMEFLMDQRFEGQLGNGLFMADLSRNNHTADGCQHDLALACGFIDRIPEFVWQDYGKRPPVQLPCPKSYVPPAPTPVGAT